MILISVLVAELASDCARMEHVLSILKLKKPINVLSASKAGLLPACVETCVGGARIFGDINDKDSFIAKQLLDAQQSGLEIRVLKPEERTKPNVFYIGLGNKTEQISDTRISY